MQYYSTRNNAPDANLEQALFSGYAPDGGLYMPRYIARLPQAFISNLKALTLPEVAYAIINYALQGDVEANVLHELVNNTLNFEMPLHRIDEDRYVLELFHGPSMAYKDLGALFMAGLLKHYMARRGKADTVNVLVPTSGDTGGAVAGGFHNVPGVNVWVLYPQDSISYMLEAQFSSLGDNVHAIEVNGSFDDCKRLISQAFKDEDLNRRLMLTSATSINVARVVPQMVYYFWAYAQLAKQGHSTSNLVFSVPCGNLGNLASGLAARGMGLPVKRFVAAQNENCVLHDYLRTGEFSPRASVSGFTPALDVGDPTNFERIVEMTGTLDEARRLIHSYSLSDQQTIDTMLAVDCNHGYTLDPHGAVAYGAMCQDLQPGETGVSLATAHPAKFSNQVEMAIGREIEVPSQLRGFFNGTRHVKAISSGYKAFKKLLLESL